VTDEDKGKLERFASQLAEEMVDAVALLVGSQTNDQNRALLCKDLHPKHRKRPHEKY